MSFPTLQRHSNSPTLEAFFSVGTVDKPPVDQKQIERIDSLGRQLQVTSEESNSAKNPINRSKQEIDSLSCLRKTEHPIPADQMLSTVSDFIVSIKINMKNYAVAGLDDPKIFEDFLALNDRPGTDETAVFTVKKCLGEIFLEDLDLFIKSSKHASNPQYPFIKKTWEEILEHLRKKTFDKKIDPQLLEFYNKIFSYVAQTPPADKMEIDVIKKVLAYLFPYTILYITDIAPSRRQEVFTQDKPFELSEFIRQFCQAWSRFKPITLPSFKYLSKPSELLDEKKFIELLIYSQLSTEYPDVAELLPLLEKELALHNNL